MAAALLSLVLASALLAAVSAEGTVVELHTYTFFVGDPLWVVPDPRVGSEGAPPGCTNLASNFTFQSGRFFWNETAGVGLCHFLWFFYEPNCGGNARGVQMPDPPEDGSPNVSQDAIYSRTTYWKIQNGRSIGCSFQKDPCEQFPCEDSNAVCNSTYGWDWKDDKGKPWANQQRQCTCKDGFTMSEGKCVTPAEACSKVVCEQPSTCEAHPLKGAQCVCPTGYTKDNSTGKCTAGNGAWLNALNNVRTEASATESAPNSAAGLSKSATAAAAPLEWDLQLAAVAKNWTLYLNSTQCGADPVVLTKMPGSNYSESDVWVSWSADESAAVQLWAPSPTDATNPRTARITSQGSQLTGCGKTTCGAGAFFTCLFWPQTY